MGEVGCLVYLLVVFMNSCFLEFFSIDLQSGFICMEVVLDCESMECYYLCVMVQDYGLLCFLVIIMVVVIVVDCNDYVLVFEQV